MGIINNLMIIKLRQGLANLERLEKYSGVDGKLRLEGSPIIDVAKMKIDLQAQLDELEKRGKK